MRPTDEQLAALELFRSGDSMVVEAGAGTGKTSTLKLLAASTLRRGRYIAYNKAIVTDVAGRISERCEATTMHSLAFGAVGKRYAHRLNSPRMKSRLIAQRLDLRPLMLRITVGSVTEPKELSDGYLGGLVMRSVGRFCASTDETPGSQHVPYVEGLDFPDDKGNRTYANNRILADHLEAAMGKAWADICNRDGDLPFRHDHYLKLWHLERPRLPADYILLDEAQDADPVIADIVGRQEHAQRVYVGDAQQAIYEWRGAVNAMEGFDPEHRRQLTQSFRFGPAIADEANRILADLAALEGKPPLVLSGLDSIDSTVGELEPGQEPDCVLCRSNAQAVETVLKAQRAGRIVHLVGGGTEVVSFARGVRDLQKDGWTSHADLACFNSWGEVKEYVRQDAQGHELKLLVDLVEEFGVATILKALERMPSEGSAALTVSTAHKAKGREWAVVRLAEDFAMVEPSVGELRLRYVASTRARMHLDNSCFEEADVHPALIPAAETG